MLDRIVAGDALNFATNVAGYAASAGWVLKFRIVPRSTGSAIDITCTAEGDDHRAQVDSSVTRTWTAGFYSWHSYVAKAGQEYTVGTGSLQILPDPRQVSTLDLRTSAQTALDAVQALLQGKATSGQKSYTIGERSLESYSITELLQLESKLTADVAREQRAAALAAGQKDRRRAYVRMGRA